ncbi:hypothetical protein P8C59_006469 [Phyllachora maydis]|uniref:Reverse transcriptase Ty1/copia-type domain-containing protein n=1 Tax=Phyllachora maydis TaxID=1825666 RepID=A0AAD9MFJ2_9PEZI|nr:hypothetical protein P8C59_006469 [Phyllachora maydis]
MRKAYKHALPTLLAAKKAALAAIHCFLKLRFNLATKAKNKDNAYNKVYKPSPNLEEEGSNKDNSKKEEEKDNNSNNNSTGDSTSNSKDKARSDPGQSSRPLPPIRTLSEDKEDGKDYSEVIEVLKQHIKSHKRVIASQSSDIKTLLLSLNTLKASIEDSVSTIKNISSTLASLTNSSNATAATTGKTSYSPRFDPFSSTMDLDSPLRPPRKEPHLGPAVNSATSNLDPPIDTGSKEGFKDTITSSIVKELSKKAYTIPDDRISNFLENPNISNTYSNSDQAVLLMLLYDSLSSSPRAAISWIYIPSKAFKLLVRQYSRPIESKKEDVYNEFHALTFSTYRKGLSAFNAKFNGYLAKLTIAKIDIDPSLILNQILGLTASSLNIEYLMADILEESRNPAIEAYRAGYMANSSNSTPNSNSNPSKRGKNKKKGKKKASYNIKGQNYSAKSAEQASFMLGSYNLAIEEEEEFDSSSNSRYKKHKDFKGKGLKTSSNKAKYKDNQPRRRPRDPALYNSWLYDTGSTDHISNSQERFTTFTPNTGQLRPINTGNSTVSPAGIGSITLEVLSTKAPPTYTKLVLDNVLYLPNININIVSRVRHYDSGGCLIKETLYRGDRRYIAVLDFKKSGFFLDVKGSSKPILHANFAFPLGLSSYTTKSIEPEPEPLTGTRDLPYMLRELVIEGNKVEKAISSPTLKEPNIEGELVDLDLDLEGAVSLDPSHLNTEKPISIEIGPSKLEPYESSSNSKLDKPLPDKPINPVIVESTRPTISIRKPELPEAFPQTIEPIFAPKPIEVIAPNQPITNEPLDNSDLILEGDKMQLDYYKLLAKTSSYILEEIYMEIPEGLLDLAASNKAIYKLLLKYGYNPSTPNIIKLSKALYSLKQSPREWQDKLKILLKSLGYLPLISDPRVFYNAKTCYFIVTYIDDCLFIGPNIGYLTDLKKRLNKVYAIEDLGPAAYFLGLARSLNRPTKLHLNAAKNLFKYLNSTKDYSICFSYNGNTVADLGPKLSNSSNITTKLSRDFHSKEGPRPLTTTSTTIVDSRNSKGRSRTSIINSSLVPIGFSDSDFAGDKATSKSTYSYLYKLAGRPISWKTKRATTIALSTLEAETDGLTEAIHEVQTKHTLLKFRYVREQVKAKIVTIIYLNTNDIKTLLLSLNILQASVKDSVSAIKNISSTLASLTNSSNATTTGKTSYSPRLDPFSGTIDLDSPLCPPRKEPYLGPAKDNTTTSNLDPPIDIGSKEGFKDTMTSSIVKELSEKAYTIPDDKESRNLAIEAYRAAYIANSSNSTPNSNRNPSKKEECKLLAVLGSKIYLVYILSRRAVLKTSTIKFIEDDIVLSPDPFNLNTEKPISIEIGPSKLEPYGSSSDKPIFAPKPIEVIAPDQLITNEPLDNSNLISEGDKMQLDYYKLSAKTSSYILSFVYKARKRVISKDGTPTTYKQVLKLPRDERNKWLEAITKEFIQLLELGVFKFLPRSLLPSNYKLITCRNVLKVKKDAKKGPFSINLRAFCNAKTYHFIVTYIDDCLFIGPNIGYITDLKKRLNKSYTIEDLGPAAYFLGWLSRSLNRPTKSYSNAAKNLFKYLNSTKDYSICFSYNGNTVADLGPKLSKSSNTTTKLSRDFHPKEGPRPLTTTSPTIVDSRNGNGSSRTSIINSSLVPIGYSDSDFAGDKATSKSTYGYLYKLAGGPIS